MTSAANGRMPLVFMNTCGSSCVVPGGAASFSSLFLRRRHRGFIGTQASPLIPWGVRFPQFFYARLIAPGRESLGMALVKSRWDLVEQDRNPFGLFYTSYASPELRVWHPDESATGATPESRTSK